MSPDIPSGATNEQSREILAGDYAGDIPTSVVARGLEITCHCDVSSIVPSFAGRIGLSNHSRGTDRNSDSKLQHRRLT